MARAAPKLTDGVAAAFGRLVGIYSRAVVTPASTEIMLDAPLPRESAVWIGWHEGKLLALALHGRVTNRGAMAFVPPGFNGAAMHGSKLLA
jgi:hypothetical protein